MLTAKYMRVGGKYNWKGQAERLVYLGVQWYSGNGIWHQFALVDEPNKVWCEVQEADLSNFEETPIFHKAPLFNNITPQTEVEVWNAQVEARKAEKLLRRSAKKGMS